MWRFRRDESGGAMLVMGFMLIAVAVLSGLSAFAMTSGIITLSQRVTQASEASVRAAVDTVIAEVNSGDDTQKTLDSLVGREFVLNNDGPVQGETTITAATFDGREVTMDLSVESTGRMEWERRGTATLRLAQAVSLSRIEDGRAVWDFAAPSGANSSPDQVVALWTPGELEVFVPGLNVDEPTAPNQPNLITNIERASNGTFSVSIGVTDAGGCWAGERTVIQQRFMGVSGTWEPWKTTATGVSMKQWSGAGATFSIEARARCESADRISNWATKNASVTISDYTVTVPAPTVTRKGDTVTVTPNKPTAPSGATVVTQVQYKVNGQASGWHQADSFDVQSGGKTVQVQARSRMQLADGSDTGWVSSPLVTK